MWRRYSGYVGLTANLKWCLQWKRSLFTHWWATWERCKITDTAQSWCDKNILWHIAHCVKMLISARDLFVTHCLVRSESQNAYNRAVSQLVLTSCCYAVPAWASQLVATKKIHLSFKSKIERYCLKYYCTKHWIEAILCNFLIYF